MERKFRLTRTTDFMRVRRSGKSYAHPLVVLIVSRSEETSVRIGVSASQAVGKAVQRNRAKRRIRACLAPVLTRIKPGSDLIFLARRPIEEAQFEQLCSAVQNLLKRAGLLEEIDGTRKE